MLVGNNLMISSFGKRGSLHISLIIWFLSLVRNCPKTSRSITPKLVLPLDCGSPQNMGALNIRNKFKGR